ncbi:anthranilate synthase component 1 [Wohlfahrtiimonas larvae]|uniref:Anthranilate synthase component 1 n=1 Tax=Wohlfahrtiimonas larvae TaxID=1157986 RepID=A0ABP9MYJ8_9GAMM|nr:anthranilate synthase component 1 [Wohlfahrtiimonas larvae]
MIDAFSSLQTVLNYQDNPAELFHHYCENKANTLLLESADVNSKENLKSLLVIESAVKITANNHLVTYKALTENGLNLLPIIQKTLSSMKVKVELNGTTLQATFPKIQDGLSEDEKLCSLSIFDGLRVLLTIAQENLTNPEELLMTGLFAYELAYLFEPVAEENFAKKCADYTFYIAEHMITLDHQTKQSKLISLVTNHDTESQIYQTIKKQHEKLLVKYDEPISIIEKNQFKNESSSVSTNIADDDFGDKVKALKGYIQQGDVFQVVPSRQFYIECPSPFLAYLQLKQNNPSPYLFYMQDQDFTLFGASPESALKYTKNSNEVELYPIAGTRPRGFAKDGSINRDLDSRLELSLRTDQKELSEHFMLVDLARNDLAKICVPGSRHVADLTKVDRYAYVMHLVSRVVGQLKNNLDCFHAYQSTMNMGTLTGAPKIRAMQLIHEHENVPRGSYGGAVGYFTGKGDFDTCIVIRSAFVQDGIATVQAGAGVVKNSDPSSEMEETKSKARSVVNAILQAHQSKEKF